MLGKLKTSKAASMDSFATNFKKVREYTERES